MRYIFEKAVDLTHELANGMPIYPGDPSPSFERSATIEKNGVNLTKLTLGSHTGTHTDAPIHFISGGESIDQIPVKSFIGEALVVDLSKTKAIGSGIVPSDLQEFDSQIRDDDIVLLYTGSSDKWGDPAVNSNYTYCTKEAADYFVSKKVRAVGIDFLSIEKFKAPEPIVHKTLLKNGIYIIESLSSALKQFSGQRILLISLPIKLENGDGAPSRSIAVPIEGD
ncbi:MAG: cyclase family protein [archaeon]|nr:cyclase family protein [archaeon]